MGAQKDFASDYDALGKYIEAQIGEKQQDKYTANIKSSPQVQMGVITEVKYILRKVGVLAINCQQ